MSEYLTEPQDYLGEDRRSIRRELTKTGQPHMRVPTLSVVTPAHNEQASLPILYDRLQQAIRPEKTSWEWIVVDDHSGDSTFAILQAIASSDPRVRGVRLSRNSGSHLAIACGLDLAHGRAAIVMAADLQDPPELIPALMERWRGGSQIVWAVRERREGIGVVAHGFSRLYYWMMRNVVGLTEIAPEGADFFLVDRVVIDAVKQLKERNASLFALLSWMGFRKSEIRYEKAARLHGATSWSLSKKLRLVVDSFTSFSHKPIRWMAGMGFTVALLGFGYAVSVFLNAIGGQPVEGWTSLMIVVLILCGSQMLMLGVMGEYLWRALDEARQRPRYLVEATTRIADTAADGVEVSG